MVSSLGIIPRDTIKDVEKLLRKKKIIVKRTLKRCVVAAVIGSYNVFYKKNLLLTNSGYIKESSEVREDSIERSVSVTVPSDTSQVLSVNGTETSQTPAS